MILVLGLLYGCGPRSLNYGAENVHLYSSLPSMSCKFVGDILNDNVHGDLLLTSSLTDIRNDDINFLKNQGYKLGGNVVILKSHTSVAVERRLPGKIVMGVKPRTRTFNEHKIMARVYFCSSVLNMKNRNSNTTHVKIEETPLIK